MLTITKLADAEYLIGSVADGIEDYYMGVGRGARACGRAAGRPSSAWRAWSRPTQLRALVEGRDPATGVELLAGAPGAGGARPST